MKNQGNSAVVAEYTYNGLGMPTGWRIGWRFVTGGDADADADVDGSDPWYSFAMDDRWRVVATFRGSDTSPKELFAYHNAGANGRGSSSYIDSVILRNRDANTSWTSSADGVLEERIYYVQNWRADVSAVLSDAGVVKEWVKYTSYGIPIRIDPGDYNRDGYVNGNDYDDFADDFDSVVDSADVNFDGYVNGDDYDLFADAWESPSTAGRNALTAPSVGNRIGYAGYQHEPAVAGAGRAVYHVRNRVYDGGMGRWTTRDPIGYEDTVNMLEYGSGMPVIGLDPQGTLYMPCTSGCDQFSSSGNSTSGGSGSFSSDAISTLFFEQQQAFYVPRPLSVVFDWKDCPEFSRCDGSIVHRRGRKPRSNGCGANRLTNFGLNVLNPMFNDLFTPCCNNHDTCYSTCGANRNLCDKLWLECMLEQCSQVYMSSVGKPNIMHPYSLYQRCVDVATAYYIAVQEVGRGPFCAAQNDDCVCTKLLPPPLSTAPRQKSPSRMPRPDPKRPLW